MIGKILRPIFGRFFPKKRSGAHKNTEETMILALDEAKRRLLDMQDTLAELGSQLRIEEAKRLLLENPEMSINIIAELSGFSDRSNFHRQFTKIVGCSPKQWRDTYDKSE